VLQGAINYTTQSYLSLTGAGPPEVLGALAYPLDPPAGRRVINCGCRI